MYDALYPRVGGIMNDFEREVLVLEMVERATERGGGTHEPRLHAYSFFLQEIRGVPTEYEFYRRKRGTCLVTSQGCGRNAC